MTWNHRVVRIVTKNLSSGSEVSWGIKEVYYHKGRKPYAYTKDFMAPVGGTIGELRESLVLMLRATYHPRFKPSEIVRKKNRSK